MINMVTKIKCIYANEKLLYRFKLLSAFHGMKGIQMLDKLITYAEQNPDIIQCENENQSKA